MCVDLLAVMKTVVNPFSFTKRTCDIEIHLLYDSVTFVTASPCNEKVQRQVLLKLNHVALFS